MMNAILTLSYVVIIANCAHATKDVDDTIHAKSKYFKQSKDDDMMMTPCFQDESQGKNEGEVRTKSVAANKYDRNKQIDDEWLIESTYGNLFFSPPKLEILLITETSLADDGDTCCPTSKTFLYNETMTDIHQQLWKVVHLTHFKPYAMYQIMPVGTCLSGGSCSGYCVQEYMIHLVLVYETKSANHPPVAFHQFRLPAYCSCKNVGI